MFRIYPANTHPKFPEGGKLTQYLDNLSLGDAVDGTGRESWETRAEFK